MGIYDDMMRSTYGDPADSYSQPTNTTPDVAQDKYRYAALNMVDPNDVSNEDVERFRAEKVFENAGPVFQEKMQDPVFKTAVRGSEEKVKHVETLFGMRSDTAGTTQKAFARGVADGMMIEYGLEVAKLRTDIDTLRMEQSKDPENPRLQERIKEYEEEAKHLASLISRLSSIRKAFYEGSYDEKVERGDYDWWREGIGSVYEAFVQNMTTAAPFIGATALAAAATPAVAVGSVPLLGTLTTAGIAGGITQFLGTYAQDFGLGLISKMDKHGIDTTDEKAVADYILNSVHFEDDRAGAARHAVGPAALESLALHGSTKVMGHFLGTGAREAMPTTASIAMRAQEQGAIKTFGHALAVSQLEGAAGAFGEAAGQILDEGEITDARGILYEYLVQVGQSPVTASIATMNAQAEASVVRQRAEQNRATLAEAMQAVHDTEAFQRSPEMQDMYLDEVAAESPQFSTLRIDVASLAQNNAPIIDRLSGVLPERSTEITHAVETGGFIEVSLAEYANITKNEADAQAILDHTGVGTDQSSIDAQEAQESIEDSKKFVFKRFAEGQDDAWRDSYFEVARQLNEILTPRKAETTQRTERMAIFSLTMAHIANMSKDTGMTPEQIWASHGIRAVLNETDVQRNDDGTLTPISERAKNIFADKVDRSLAQTQSGDVVVPNGEFLIDYNTIIRWSGADRSTLLHETGHWFLKARVGLARSLQQQALLTGTPLTKEQQFFVDSTEKAVQWLGAKDIESFYSMQFADTVDMQEKFARTYEQYLKEGRAPNSSLVSVFRKFSTWLKRVYGAFVAVNGSELNASTKELFDNLFISSEQTKEAAIRRNLYANLDAADLRGNANVDGYNKGAIPGDDALVALGKMFEESELAAIDAYNERGKAVVGLVRKAAPGMIPRLEKRAEAIRKRLTREEIDRVWGAKRLNARKILRKGVPALNAKGQQCIIHPKIYIKALQAAGATKAQIAALEAKGLVTKTNGMHAVDPAAFCQRLGYTSLDEFINDFSVDPFHGQKEEDFVHDAVEQRMEDEYPEYKDHESIAESADAALFNMTAEKIIFMEINYLESRFGEKVTTPRSYYLNRDVFQAVAEAELADRVVATMTPYNYRNTAEQLARQAQRLIAKGNLKEAGSVKRRQLVQMYMARLAQEKKDRANMFVKKMRKQYNSKTESNSLGVPFLKQVRAVLTGIGITDSELQGTQDYDDFVTDNQVFVNLPDMPDAVRNRIPFRDMTSKEVDETIQFVEDLVSAGRDRYSVEVEGKRLSLDLIDAEEAAAIQNNVDKKGLKPVRQNDDSNSRWLDFTRTLRDIKYNHAKFFTLWRVFEGEKFGTFFKYIGKRIDDARNKSDELTHEKTEALYNAMSKLSSALRDTQKRRYDMLGGSFDKRQIIAMALNIGNRSNFERLLDGSDQYVDFRDKNQQGKIEKKWTRQDVLTAVGKALTFDELKTIQAIWDICGSLGDDLYNLDVRTRNKHVDKVEPEPVTIKTADNKAIMLKGGYYPVMYESGSFDSKNSLDTGNKPFAQGSRNSDTSHSKARGGLTGKPISLTTEAMYGEIKDVINDICYREILVDLNKIMADGTRTRSLIQTYFGKEAVREINNWMVDIASGGSNIKEHKLLGMVRKNVGIAGLGLNATTMLLQAVGMTQSAAVVGGKWCAKGMLQYVSHMPTAIRTTMSKSSMMRSRMRTRFKELSEVQTQFSGKDSIHNWMARKVFLPIVFMQMGTVDIPTWLGAYDKFIAEGKKNMLTGTELEEYAVSRADRSVIDAQGGGDLADLSSVERTKSVWNVFYSFFGTALNAAVTAGHTEKGIERAMTLLLMFAIQPTIESFIRAGFDQAAGDDDEYGEAVMKRLPADLINFPLGMAIVAREFSPAVSAICGQDPYGYSGPAGVRIIQDSVKLALQAHQGELDKGMAKAIVNVLSDILGLPAAAINRMIDTFAAWDDGKDITPLNILFGYKGD